MVTTYQQCNRFFGDIVKVTPIVKCRRHSDFDYQGVKAEDLINLREAGFRSVTKLLSGNLGNKVVGQKQYRRLFLVNKN